MTGTSLPSRIAVIVLTFEQRVKTLAFLQQLLATEEPPFDVLLWDNGSTDGTAEAVRAALPRVVVHQHERNLGVAGGRNAAAAAALNAFRPTHFAFLDNDLDLAPGFLRELYRPFEEEGDRLAQTQAKLRFLHDPERINDGGGNRISWWLARTRPVGCGEIDRGQYDRQRPCVAGGGAMMVRADVFQQLGGFDTGFSPAGPEDLDFSLRLREAGYEALFVPRALAYHEHAHTFGREYGEEYARLKARHWLVFMRRHAPRLQRLAFYVAGVPLLALRIAARETRRGNLRAVRGLARGALQALRSRDGGNESR